MTLLSRTLRVQTPKDYLDAKYIQLCPVMLGNWMFLANLVLLPLKEFDVVLEMDWHIEHHATLNCEQRMLTFNAPGKEEFVQ